MAILLTGWLSAACFASQASDGKAVSRQHKESQQEVREGGEDFVGP